MTKFNNARLGTTGKTVSVEEMEKLPIGDPKFDDLQCPECGCQLIFYHTGNTRVAHFSTRTGFEHDEDCPLGVDHSKATIVPRYTESEEIWLTPEMQHTRARSMYQSMKQKQNGNSSGDSGTRTSKRTKSKNRVPSTVRTDEVHLVPTADKNKAGAVSGEMRKNVPIARITPNILKPSLINAPGTFGGVLREIRINRVRELVYIDTEYAGVNAYLVLNPAFFQGASTGCMDLLEAVAKEFTDNTLITAVVDVVPDSDGNPECMVREENSILLNGHPMRVYLSLIRKLAG
jgi:hypothetical protein